MAKEYEPEIVKCPQCGLIADESEMDWKEDEGGKITACKCPDCGYNHPFECGGIIFMSYRPHSGILHNGHGFVPEKF